MFDLHTCKCTTCVLVGSPEIGVTDDCKIVKLPPYGCWEWKAHPLKEQKNGLLSQPQLHGECAARLGQKRPVLYQANKLTQQENINKKINMQVTRKMQTMSTHVKKGFLSFLRREMQNNMQRMQTLPIVWGTSQDTDNVQYWGRGDLVGTKKYQVGSSFDRVLGKVTWLNLQ